MRFFKPYLIAIVFLLVVDPLFSIFSHVLSGNIRHIKQIPDIAQRIKDSETPSLLFLGNSLTNNGFEEKFVERSLEGFNKDFHIEKITPDGTDLWDWYFIVQNHFIDNDIEPKIVVVGFAWDILADRRPPNPTRLGGYFCDLSDIIFLNRHYPFTISQNSEFILSKISSLYANRDNISKRVLDWLIPVYRENTRRINDFFNEKANTTGNPDNTYSRLQLFVERLADKNIRVLFVAMPVTDRYDVDPHLVKALRASGGYFFDARALRSIIPSSFKDSIHLNEKGSAILTDAVIAHLAYSNLI